MFKQRHLEATLSQLEGFENPKYFLEQYMIPARLAAMIVWRAYQLGDILEKEVADYCCGTGILAIGAALMGAKTTWGIDIDEDALKIAGKNAKKTDVEITWKKHDVIEEKKKFDTIFMNSPFGVQSNIRDREYLSSALKNSNVCYSIHLYQDNNKKFLERFISETGKNANETMIAEFELPKTYNFHKKRFHIIKVLIIRSI